MNGRGLVQRIIEVRDELDAGRATGRPDAGLADFLAGLEVAASFTLNVGDAAVLAADLQRRQEVNR